MNHPLKHRPYSWLLGLLLVFSASAASADIRVSDWNVDFGDVRTDSHFGEDETVEVWNIGRNTTRIKVQDACFRDFSIDDWECDGKNLAPGQKCRIEIDFRPPQAGRYSCTIWVSDSTGKEHPIHISGTGVEAN